MLFFIFFFFVNRENDRMLHLFVSECKLPDISNILYIVEFYTLAVLLRNFLYVFLIGLAHHDIYDTSSFGC